MAVRCWRRGNSWPRHQEAQASARNQRPIGPDHINHQPVFDRIALAVATPVDQREGLPPLRLSMHVYDADPAGRFVLIDGRRYRQGDAIGDGLVVEVIRPDGALVARGSLRFLVPRP